MKRYTHPSLPIEAPENYWRAAGYVFYSSSLECQKELYIAPSGGMERDRMDQLLMIALANGRSQEDAIAWAMAERQRQNEASSASHALASEANALRELASALRQAGEDTVLEKILSRVSEKTRYAIRRQLKGGGL